LIEDMKGMRAKGHSLRFIAEEFGVGRGTAEKYTKAQNGKRRSRRGNEHVE
jgi:transposase